MKKCVLTILVLSLTGSLALAATGNANDPSWDNPINPNGKTMYEEIGNYSIVQWNANPSSIVFDMEDLSATYPNYGDQLGSIVQHTTTGSPINLRTYLDAVSPYGRILDGTTTARASSGNISLAYNCGTSKQAIIRFTNWFSDVNYAPVLGVGMVLHRLIGDMGVTLYRTDDSVIDSFTVHSNTGSGKSEFSFFGYKGATAEIAKVKLDATLLGGQFWLDDLSILDGTVPEPTTMFLLGLGGVLLARRRK